MLIDMALFIERNFLTFRNEREGKEMVGRVALHSSKPQRQAGVIWTCSSRRPFHRDGGRVLSTSEIIVLHSFFQSEDYVHRKIFKVYICRRSVDRGPSRHGFAVLI